VVRNVPVESDVTMAILLILKSVSLFGRRNL
jgi:hypothetical protein